MRTRSASISRLKSKDLPAAWIISRRWFRKIPSAPKFRRVYDKQFPGTFLFAAGSAATGTYRGLKLWEAAVKEAGKLDRDAVAAALDHAKIAEGPGGPAEMVPGQRHCKMKMYTAVAKGGNYEIVARSAGLVDPKEC